MIKYRALFLFSMVIFSLILAVSYPANAQGEDPKTKYSDQDSLKKSNEYLRLIGFLNWYKTGHDQLYLPNIEKYHISDTLNYAYIDTVASQSLINKYISSNYFTNAYINELTSYINEAKQAYRNRDLEVYDYFDHDFILLTQEVDETLSALSTISVLPEYCNLDAGQVSISIGDFVNLNFIILEENGVLKINQIKNLGIIKKNR